MREKLKTALRLYCYFFKIGWFTFGGGWSIVAQMQTDFVEKKKVMDDQELLDITSVGKSLPGIMICNSTYLFGHHQGGAPGGFLAVLGIATPPLIILSVVTFFYHAVRDNMYVARAMAGVRAVVVSIILSAVLKLQKTQSSLSRPAFYGLCAASCALSFALRINNVLIVLAGVAIGLLYHVRQRGDRL